MTSFTDLGGKIQFNKWGLASKGTVTPVDSTEQATQDLTLKIYNQSETFSGMITQTGPDCHFDLASSSGADHFSMDLVNGVVQAGASGTINGHSLFYDGMNRFFT